MLNGNPVRHLPRIKKLLSSWTFWFTLAFVSVFVLPFFDYVIRANFYYQQKFWASHALKPISQALLAAQSLSKEKRDPVIFLATLSQESSLSLKDPLPLPYFFNTHTNLAFQSISPDSLVLKIHGASPTQCYFLSLWLLDTSIPDDSTGTIPHATIAIDNNSPLYKSSITVFSQPGSMESARTQVGLDKMRKQCDAPPMAKYEGHAMEIYLDLSR